MQNRKIMIGAVVFTLSMATHTAYGSEIAGTRVEGQGAVCSDGQSKALEINATTKQQWSYCITPLQLPIPHQTPAPTPSASPKAVEPSPTPTTGSISEPSYEVAPISPSPTVTETSTVTTTPSPQPSAPIKPESPTKSNVYIADVTANTTIVRPETDDEWEQRVEVVWLKWYEEILKWLAQILNWGWMR